MKYRFSLLAKVVEFVLIAGAVSANAAINCQWNAINTQNNVNAEDNLKTLEACSLFIRGILLENASHPPSNIAELGIGKQLEGDLIFTDSTGQKIKCQTILVKNPPEFLNKQEYLVSYLKAEIDGEALSPADQTKADQILKKIGVDPIKVIEKIDRSLRLNCTPEMM